MQTKVKFFSWLTAAILFTFSLHLQAQDISVSPIDVVEETAPSIPLTTIQFEEMTYDFGEVEQGEKVLHVYTFTNTGSEPLVFSNARGSCGCTVPEWPRDAIAPGEIASITVEFNSKNKKGKRNQKVTLTANTNPPQTFIYLTGTITTDEVDNYTPILAEDKTTEVINNDCFVIFPNPTAEVLKLKMEESSYGKPAVISIYSKAGQLMAKREIKSIEGTIEFNVSHYPADTYVADVQIGDNKLEARCFVVTD